MNDVTVMKPVPDFDQEKLDLIKRTFCKEATNDEFALFMQVCKRTQLDPFSRQMYSIKRWDSMLKRYVHTPQTSIDGLRVIAERSGEYAGQDGPFWCGEDGLWKDVWLSKDLPVASKVTVFKKGMDKGFTGVALFAEYAQHTKDGGLTNMWKSMPSNQLAKCAESLALRKAFPNTMSGLYTVEEFPSETHAVTPPLPAEAIKIVQPEAHQTEPRETGFAPVPEVVATPTQVKRTSAASLENYVIPDGSLKGVKFKDKPEAFWMQYAQDLTEKMNTIPFEYRSAAENLVLRIEQYLAEKM